ncbi:MAG: cytochrome c maturation protein CcmE [Rhodobacteraceae bacterium]|uniref:cytochrome c maturation protein CcmE n=1 Tax=Celeribacter sp. HF31 TaxID=2721558 RepID=UPI00158D959E|nr:cytochrome c maturation protein CcmE [Celeribacter sp. HF31]NVK47661.1 cytochrome c maturation protein CcmE [Paracoccaceae bacterium]
MKNLKKKRRVQVFAIAAVALLVSVSLIGYAFRDGINLYRDPSKVVADPPRTGEIFRLGGLVEDGTLVRGEGTHVTFSVTDGAETIPVTFEGVLPDLFGENQGMIGTGSMVGGTFVATEILAKHDETYMPKEVMDSLKETGVYKEPES